MKATKTASLPKVTFIIPTLNAQKFLPKCLSAIRNQIYPKTKIEIVIADGGSTDKTLQIAKKYHAKVIPNPEILHEPGKARAANVAKGEIFFFTDADNIIVGKQWISSMVKPYLENKKVMGFLPQTVPAPDSNPLDRYMGYLFTDPFTWFVYGNSANPQDYISVYQPLKQTEGYMLFKFPKYNLPLFGLSQGVGTSRKFKRQKLGHNDDLLSGIKLMTEGGIVAYIPKAGVYHYHVEGFFSFLKKYRWRIRNNLQQKIRGMGFTNREKYMSPQRKKRKLLFVPYALSIIFPLFDSLKLSFKHKDFVMLWHVPACFGLSCLIIFEVVLHETGIKPKLNTVYGK